MKRAPGPADMASPSGWSSSKLTANSEQDVAGRGRGRTRIQFDDLVRLRGPIVMWSLAIEHESPWTIDGMK